MLQTCHCHIAMSMYDNDLQRYGGLQSNDLNVIMYYDDDENDENFEIPNIVHSAYIDTSELTKYLVDHKNEFTVVSLNIQSINAKFNSLYALLVELAEKGWYFSTICLQESWPAVNSDVSFLEIPNYKMFHQGKSRCSNHGGLLTYVHCNFSATVRKQLRRSLLWEGQLIDIQGESLITPISISTYIDPPRIITIILPLKISLGSQPQLSPIWAKAITLPWQLVISILTFYNWTKEKNIMTSLNWCAQTVFILKLHYLPDLQTKVVV